VVTFAAIRLLGPKFKPQPGQKFASRFMLHAHCTTPKPRHWK